MNNTLPHGVWPVMLTPFTATNAIDYPALDALIEWYIENGVAGLFAICQSSEMDYLSTEEKQSLLKHIMQRLDGRRPVVAAGLPEDNPLAYAQHARDLGVRALVLLPNRLVAVNEDESLCRDRMQSLIDQLPDMDLGLYESPLPYHRLLSAAFLQRCAHSGRFIFLKETSCQRQQLYQKLEACRDTRLQIYPAHGPSILYGLQHGSAGACNIAANFIPQLYAQLCERWQDPEAERLQDFLSISDPCMRLDYPASAKRWLAYIGLPINDHCRTASPAVKVDDECMRFASLAGFVKNEFPNCMHEASR